MLALTAKPKLLSFILQVWSGVITKTNEDILKADGAERKIINKNHHEERKKNRIGHIMMRTPQASNEKVTWICSEMTRTET